MIRTFRAAALAVAAFAFTSATAWASPLEAVGRHGGSVGAFLDSVRQTGEGLVARVAGADSARPRSLDDRVAELAGAEPEGREEECLASAVYFEARGESLEGQLAVAEVVLNRAASGRYPATWCGVVAQRSQFSFVRRGVIPRADRASLAWRRAVAIARIARDGAVRMLPQNVLWYHAHYVSPGWGRRLARSGQIGSHIFYRP